MGVTVHHFAFDPTEFVQAPCLEGWAKQGHVSDDLSVAPHVAHALREIDSVLGENKKWYRNLDAQWAWSLARNEMSPEHVKHLDHWFSHLFYDEHEPACGHTTQPVVAPYETLYDATLIAHICDLEVSLDDVSEVLARLNRDDPQFQSAKGIAHYPWMFEPEGFEWLVSLWMRLFNDVRSANPKWSLLQWVWC